METVITIFILKVLQTFDLESFFIRNRITVTGQNNADCSVIFKLQINLIQCTIDAGFHHVNNIIFHTWKDNLCLRITKSGIVLQNLRSVLCQHQSKENDTFESTSFCFHSIYRCLEHIFFAKFVYFFCIERAWRESSHTTCI